jgi:transposase-like protein
VLDELLPAACHITQQYANNAVEADHGRLKSRLRPMRGLKRLRSARVISAGHAFVQNVRRGHYELAADFTHATGSQQLSPNSPSPAEQPSIAIAAACLTSR